MNYEEEKFSNWDNLKNHLNKYPRSWIFRGQSSSSWPLTTSWERSPIDIYRKGIETNFIEGFKRGALNYLDTNEIPKNIVEWLSLMQHYGAPTRLLDFTNSPYVAAYFAVENDLNEDFSIWAIDSTPIDRKMRMILFEKYSDLEEANSTIPNEKILERFISDNNFEGILVVEPYKMNKRFRIQKGVFLCPGTTDIPFMENFKFLKEQKGFIKKLVIDKKLRADILTDLDRMNINREQLFINLQGFSKSLTTLFETQFTHLVDYKKRMDFFS